MKLIPVKVKIHCRLCDRQEQEAGGILEAPQGGWFIYICDHCFEVLSQIENNQRPPIGGGEGK